MVDINKVTNMSAEAMENLKKSSFEAASAFGRTAQDYLKGIAEFSRAGYEGQSSEDLSKISLLAQNVGELTAEQANQYLLATDAAYKYKGSQEKLMAVLDGANIIDNKFATSIAKISEGVTVAGSVSSNAGVGINELSSAIGTMTAISQRSGNEAGRAFRGILMNIRQIKGETEDGEIIDDEALSKSAKALDSVGIKVHEMRNGIEELRNPMSVLEDLSNKWKSLSTMKTSPIIEALGGKYRGNEQMLTASYVQKCV
jgi:TP901 family phage tail tape measure protein